MYHPKTNEDCYRLSPGDFCTAALKHITVTCRLGSVYVKPIVDETNEVSYLIKACEVNAFHFLYMLELSFQLQTTSAYIGLRRLSYLFEQTQIAYLLNYFSFHIFICSISETVKSPCYLVGINKKQSM